MLDFLPIVCVRDALSEPPQRLVFWNSKEVLDAPLPRFVQRIVEQ
jgi:hypothetical protein